MYMYIYLHMYIYIYIHAYMYVYVYVCIYISMYACMHIYMYMCRTPLKEISNEYSPTTGFISPVPRAPRKTAKIGHMCIQS